VSSLASALTCPSAVLAAHALGRPLDEVWSALECAERDLAHRRVVLAAIEAVLDDGCSQREVLRRLAGAPHRTLEIKEALAAGERAGRLLRTPGPRRGYRYSRVPS
jgi:hypothetical protein